MATKYTRNAVILAKLEPTYGNDASPGVTNGILCSVPTYGNEDKKTERDYIRSSFSDSGFVISARKQTINFDVEFKGGNVSGTPETTPYFDPLLQACSMIGDTIHVVPVDDGTGFTMGETVTGTTATGTIVGYDLTHVHIADVTGTYGSGETLTGGTSANTATSTGGGALTRGYYPTSNESLQKSATIYYYMDGILHKIVGSRGTFTADFETGAYPILKLQMTGLHVNPADVSNPTGVVFAEHQPPLCVSAGMKIGAYTPVGVGKAMLDAGLTVPGKEDMQHADGLSAINITDRSSKLTVDFDVDTLANFDPDADYRAGTKRSIYWTAGTSAGNTVRVVVPEAQLEQKPYADKDNRATYNLSYRCTGSDSDFLIETF